MDIYSQLCTEMVHLPTSLGNINSCYCYDSGCVSVSEQKIYL